MSKNDKNWESESLAWIHNIREAHAQSQKGKPEAMPLEAQMSLAEKYGFQFIKLNDVSKVH